MDVKKVQGCVCESVFVSECQSVMSDQGIKCHKMVLELKQLDQSYQNDIAGSVMEFTKIIPLLTTPTPDQDFVFEVIAPSIPGYAYSSAPAQV